MLGTQFDRTPIRITPDDDGYITILVSVNQSGLRESLRLIEKLLIMNDYMPIYVDLTREDLDVPVVKALIPGLEIMTVVDRFSPLSIRQFGHYLKNCN